MCVHTLGLSSFVCHLFDNLNTLRCAPVGPFQSDIRRKSDERNPESLCVYTVKCVHETHKVLLGVHL